MTRKTNGPDNPRKGGDDADAANGGGNGPSNNGAHGGAEILSLTSSPGFDLWLDRQTKKLVEATALSPDSALVDLIRNWPEKEPE